MAINLLVQYPGKVDPVSGPWPYGEPRNITAPGDGLGTPWEAALAKDIIGLQQALLTSAGITPSGTPDEVGASEYLQAIIELASGRAFTYDETGVANAYVLAARTGQQEPDSLFDGLVVKFTPGNTNTTTSTAKLGALAVKTIFMPDGVTALSGGELRAGTEYELKCNAALDFVLAGDIVTGEFTTASLAIGSQSQTDIVHGLGSDEIDYGYTVVGNNANIINKLITAGRAVSTNALRRLEGNSGIISEITTALGAPATNSIRFDTVNSSASTAAQTLTIRWWARRR